MAPSKRAIFAGGNRQVDLGRVAGVVVHVFFTGEGQFDRPAGFERQGGANGHDRIHLDRRAEGAAAGDPFHVDFAERNVEDLAQADAHVVDGLSGGPHGQPAIRVGLAHHGFGLHLGVVDLGGIENAVDDQVGFGKSFIHVAFLDVAAAGDVVDDRNFIIPIDDRVIQGRRAGQ